MEPVRSLNDISAATSSAEVFQTLHASGGAVVERIVSNGQVTEWFDQDHDEWVMVLSGAARLQFEGHDEVDLGPGQAMVIPARARHRVIWTAQPTIWVAVHFPPAA